MTALVLGSAGALGSEVSRHFSRQGIKVIGADIVEGSTLPTGGFVPLPHPGQRPSLGEVTQRLLEGVGDILDETNDDLNIVVVASGGWEGDPPNDKDDLVENAAAFGDSIDRMMRMNLYPVLAAGHAIREFTESDDGLFVVMGATAALNPTPGNIGYGLSKTATHHYVQTFGTLTESSMTTKSQRKATKALRKVAPQAFDTLTVVGILPSILDTPTNRRSMPNADFRKWTRVEDIATEIGNWVDEPFRRPHSGSLVKVFGTPDGATFQLSR